MAVNALALVLALLAAPAAAADADLTRQIVDTVLKVPTNDVDPRLIEPFLAVDPETQPKAKRAKIAAKQIELRTLLKLHDTKKKGGILPPAVGCDQTKSVVPHASMPYYQIAGYEEIFEEEQQEIEKRTFCTETEQICQFSLMIFHDKGSKKPRRLALHSNDPLMAIVASIRGKAGGQTKFFGLGGVTCSK